MVLPFIGSSRGGDKDSYNNKIYYIFYGTSDGYTIPTTLTEVEITDETVVAPHAFYNCSNVTRIKLNEGITKISNNAFYSQSKITEVNIPSTVTSIGSSAFSGCSGLTSIEIPDGVKVIERDTFYNCKGLKSITIPSSVTSINSYAFYGCTNLKDIYYPKSIDDWNCITIGTNNDILKTATIHFNSLLGDVNQDGNVNIKDVTIIQMYLANFVELNDTQKYVADVDEDGDVNIIDATATHKILCK